MKARVHARSVAGRSFGLLAILLLTVLAAGAPPARAQETPRLQIATVDASGFPDVRLNLIATGPDGRRLADISDLRLSEDRSTVGEVAISDVAAGIELTFVLDDNASFNDRDRAGDLTRAEKVRDSIILFANRFMNSSQLDRVSVIAPGDGEGRLVLDRALFANEVINEMTVYEPVTLNETPLQEMMALALRQAAAGRQDGRYQAIILFSDGAELDQQLDVPTLVDQAQRGRFPIFGAILGARADPNEIENMTALTGPTGGDYLHLDEVAAIEPLYVRLQEQRTQYELRYRSQLAEAGEHTLAVSLAGARDEVPFRLDVAPPAVEIAVDNSRPIVRALPAPDAELSAAVPAEQPVALRIIWPDEHPRDLVAASLIVDGVEQMSVAEPGADAAGLISLPWDISALDEGAYEIQARVTDELGLAAESAPMAIDVEIEGRLVVVEVTATAPAAVMAPPEAERPMLQRLGPAGTAFAILALIGAVMLVAIAVTAARRRGSARLPAPAGAAPLVEVEAATLGAPAAAARQTWRAYLEPIENAGEHAEAIPLADPAVRIGRDPQLAQLIFDDLSVSRLHARIVNEGGVFRLYDEGSASGTYRNYEQVGLKPHTLADQDDVHFGRVHLRFHLAAVDEPAPADPEQAPHPGEDAGDASTRPTMAAGLAGES